MVHPEKRHSKRNGTPEADPISPGLYVVATPIGNLGDLTPRAADVLMRAELVLAEDRRVAAKLMRHVGASTHVDNYNDHNAAKVRPGILARLQAGSAIALTSDAGTPLISDPGYKLVDEAMAVGVPVFAVPGPSAVTAALSVSGLPTDRFLFMGFPPPKQAQRRRWIEEVAGLRATLVLYESPRRLPALLADLAEVLGERPAAVARELTKLHEEVRRAGLAELSGHYRDSGEPKGEIVVVIGWADTAASDVYDVEARLAELLSRMPLRDAVDLVTAESGRKRREVYTTALALKEDGGRSD